MAKKKAEGWWIKLDYNWMMDEKMVNLRSKYGKAILVDAVNTFVLMAKCGGMADMGKPAHAEWARIYLGKTGKALTATFDKLAECDVIDGSLWHALGHVTSRRAADDAKAVAEKRQSNVNRTEKARQAAKLARAGEKAVTDPVTESVTDRQ